MNKFFLFFLVLSSAIHTVKLDFNFIALRAINILTILCVAYLFLTNLKNLRFKFNLSYVSITFSIILFFIYPISIFKSPIFFESITLYFSLILSIIPFFLLKYFLNKNFNISFFIKLIKFNIYFCTAIVLLEFILSLTTSYVAAQAGYGWFGLPRPGGFLGDPNYFSIWTTFLLFLLIPINNFISKVSNIRFIYIFVALVNFLLQARVMLFLMITSLFFFFHKRILGRFWWVNYFYVFIVLIVIVRVLIFSSILPERFTYDILSPEKNPRLQDSFIVLDELYSVDKQFFGKGLGTTKLIQERVEWKRNFGKVINVGPVYIINDFGFFGLFIFFLLIYFFYKSLNCRDNRIIFNLLLVTNFFHMQLYLPWFWVLISLIKTLDERISDKK